MKTDFSSLPESSDPDEIRRQVYPPYRTSHVWQLTKIEKVEFYFSDSNLYQDKFLLKETGGSKNSPVPIATIHNFKRMRRFQPFSAVVSALKESKVLDITDKNEIRRKNPLPAIQEKNAEDALKIVEDRAMPRSIYAKGFGEEGPSTQFDIEAFFMPYGPINAVRLRRTKEKLFKGSVFVEFDSEETQKAFLDLEYKPKYKDEELEIMSKKAYCEKKVEEIKAGKVKPQSKYVHKNKKFGNRGNDRKPSHRDNDGRGRDQQTPKSITGKTSEETKEKHWSTEETKKRAREDDEANTADAELNGAKKTKTDLSPES